MIKNTNVSTEQLIDFLKKIKGSNLRSRLFVTGLEDCWNWIGPQTGDGYGFASFKGKQRRAHVLFIELFWGCPVNYRGKKEVVMHSCNNRRCCNPLHLFVGTQSNNMLHHHYGVFTPSEVLAKLTSEIEDLIK